MHCQGRFEIIFKLFSFFLHLSTKEEKVYSSCKNSSKTVFLNIKLTSVYLCLKAKNIIKTCILIFLQCTVGAVWLRAKICGWCADPAISLHSYYVSLVQWITCLHPVIRDPGSIPRGVLVWTRDSLVGVVSASLSACFMTWRILV